MILLVVFVSFHDLMLVQLVMTMKLRLSFFEFVYFAKIILSLFSLSEVPLKFVVVVVVDEASFCVGLFLKDFVFSSFIKVFAVRISPSVCVMIFTSLERLLSHLLFR